MDTVTSEAAGDPMTASAGLPLPEPVRVSCFAPVVLPAADRPVDLSVKVTYPETGEDLPVILLSHGHGGSMYLASMYGYEPLTLFWAAHGFVVIQPNPPRRELPRPAGDGRGPGPTAVPAAPSH